MPDDRLENFERPPPTWGEWALVVLNSAFVAMGLLILPRNPSVGIVTVAFFGSCLAVAVATVLRKRRFRRFSAEKVDVIGGVPIRPKSLMMRVIGVWLFCLGAVLVIFGHDYPLIFRGLAAGTGVIGLVVFAGAMFGAWPAGYLQFDPEGLTIAERGWRARLAWDDIVFAGEGDFHSNPVLLISVADPARIEIMPEGAQDRALKRIARTRTMMGTDFAVMTTHYGIDLPVLAATVVRYVEDAAARRELRPRLA